MAALGTEERATVVVTAGPGVAQGVVGLVRRVKEQYGGMTCDRA